MTCWSKSKSSQAGELSSESTGGQGLEPDKGTNTVMNYSPVACVLRLILSESSCRRAAYLVHLAEAALAQEA
jgi:hypothetical protein